MTITVAQINKGKRLDVFLAENFTKVSRELIKKKIKKEGVLVNDKVIKDPNYRLRISDTIEFEISAPNLLEPMDLPLNVIHESEEFLIIDKPAGISVHPSLNRPEKTLVNILLFHYPDIKNIGSKDRPGIVHRLDKDTSGLILVARTDSFFKYAQSLFKSRQVDKIYTALLCGRLNQPNGIIDKPLQLNHAQRKVIVHESGKPAKTEYQVLEYYQDNENKDYTLVKIVLHTGRTHQIRVHFAHLGFPLAGDAIYKGCNLFTLNRQFLHASQLSFKTPDGVLFEARSKLSQDLQQTLDKLNKIS